jgi:hypothetical protein
MKTWNLGFTASESKPISAEVLFIAFTLASVAGVVLLVTDDTGIEVELREGERFKLSQPTKRIYITNTSASPVDVSLVIGSGEFASFRMAGEVGVVDFADLITASEATQAAAGNIVGVLGDINNSMTLATALKLPDRFDSTGDYAETSGLTANTAVAVFAPASNTSGAIVWAASATSYNSPSGHRLSLLAKTGAPTTINDGKVIAVAVMRASSGSIDLSLARPIFLPAGLGLYFIADLATAGGWNNEHRMVNYTLLP